MIEVMVAGAIGVMLLGILYSVFSGSTNVSRRVEGKNELIQSATLGEDGDVFLLDMGEPVRILDLARLMIQHLIPNVKGMGGLYDALSDLKAAIEKVASEMGIPVPPDLMDITIR